MNKDTLQPVNPTDLDSISSYDNFHEQKKHENLEYPVIVYYIDLERTYMHRIRWHWHEEIEVLVVSSGKAKVVTDDHTYVVKPGQGFILNQNVMHAIHRIDDENCTFYSLVFHPDFLFGHDSSYMRARFLLPVQDTSILKTMLLDEENKWHEDMLDMLNETIAINQTKDFGYEIATRGCLCQFWSILLSKLPKSELPQDPRGSLDEQRVKQAMLFIRLHHADPLTLDDIADSIPVSKSECCRCFKRTIQMTPFEYLMKYRIFEASKKLLDSNTVGDSIADLALSVGFNNISYFNKLFKRYLDCTPTEYREKMAANVSIAASSPFRILI